MARKKLLLIDDSQTQLLYEKMMLGADYEIVTAIDGRLGVEAAEKEKPDLILCDIIMPVMDGIEALRILRSQDSTKNIPVIMVTTKSEEDRVSTCYQLGCADYVTKPVDKTELLTKVQRHLTEAPVSK